MYRISLHMNAIQGGANLHPGADLHPDVFLHQGAKLHMNTAFCVTQYLHVNPTKNKRNGEIFSFKDDTDPNGSIKFSYFYFEATVENFLCFEQIKMGVTGFILGYTCWENAHCVCQKMCFLLDPQDSIRTIIRTMRRRSQRANRGHASY